MDRKCYYIATRGVDVNTAGIKAPKDIETILNQRNYKAIRFYLPTRINSIKMSIWIYRCVNLLNWLKAFLLIKNKAIVVVQYPYGCGRIAVKAMCGLMKWKHVKTVALLHDIDSLRGFNAKLSTSSEEMFKVVDFVICHNEKMKSYLLSQGINKKCLYTLGLFDYLCSEPTARKNCDNTVALAGNLSAQKSPYIGKLMEMKKNFRLDVYGPNYDKKANYINTNYCGQFAPDDLPNEICGNWGLVWDGDSLESCTGRTGNYLRYNNPHKVSLYVAAELPVIIWKEAALANYVEEKNIGITINSLREVDTAVAGVSKEEYKEMLQNIREEGRLVRSGYYLNRVMDAIEKES